ncbi:MT-A70 family methyltransferase [Vibrio diazotrophicus]|uniref:MT-A70 family methyltransferase n=1 Tax=Vibrio diazotrophicus TaxID=685 RepID=UPI003D2F5BF5
MAYQLIYADPPWRTNNVKTGGSMTSGAQHQYNTMSTKELCEMPVRDIIADESILIMWYLSSMPMDAIQVGHAWGFKKFLNMNALVWGKLTKSGKHHFGLGFGTRASTESALLMYNGSISRSIVDKSQRNYFEAKIPVDENGKYIHSKKPIEAYEKVEALVGNVPRLEMFARCDEKREGWDVFGNQAASSIIYQPAQFIIP